MQHLNWDDLRFFLALSRNRSFSAAALALGVDGTTVSRRIKALENQLETQLIERRTAGVFELSDAGLAVAKSAELTERETDGLRATLSNAETKVSGRVVLTAVPVLTNHILIPAARALMRRHPALEIHLVAENRNLSLANREADIALRLARPIEGGLQITARRISKLAYAVYIAHDYTNKDAPNCPWISYQDAMEHLPQAQWMNKEALQTPIGLSNLRVSELEGAIEAVANGYGKSLLPCIIADADTRLRKLDHANTNQLLTRDVWLLARTDMLRLARIRGVLDWLDQLFESH